MTQYCRYCTHFVTGNGNWCEEKFWSPSDFYAKASNHCKQFELNPVDAFGENDRGYQPRQPKPKRDDGQQLSMFA